jgi:hypothetical protein
MRHLFKIIVSCLLLFSVLPPIQASAEDETNGQPISAQKKPTLVKAVMCEAFNGQEAVNPAIVFPITIGKVYCFTYFDPVPEKAVVFHRWYLRDRLNSNIKLRLQPPRWSTYSNIQLRDADKGPWRVEIADENGRILNVLRFSITD